MSLKQIMEQNPNVQLVVTASDLRELFDEWQKETQRQIDHAKAKQQASSTSDELLTSKDVLGIMRVSRSMLWKLAKQQKLMPVHIGRKVLYRLADVEAWMQQNRVTPLVEAQQSAIVHVVKGDIK